MHFHFLVQHKEVWENLNNAAAGNLQEKIF